MASCSPISKSHPVVPGYVRERRETAESDVKRTIYDAATEEESDGYSCWQHRVSVFMWRIWAIRSQMAGSKNCYVGIPEPGRVIYVSYLSDLEMNY
jgi:hypothetical protein